MNASFIPKQTLCANWLCEWLWLKTFYEQRKQEILQKIAFANKDEIYFFRRICRKNHYNYDAIIDRNHSFYRCIKGIPTIILAPEIFEFMFRHRQANETFFHVAMQKNEEKYKTEDYKGLLLEIERHRENSKFKVIYVAFGTLSGMDFKNVQAFFIRLCNALMNEQNILLVFSKGGLDMDLPKISNVRYLKYMPQINLLQYCDLMISHGGLGTIKECYDANVPMLIFPLNEKVDQNGNANRMKVNGFALKGNVITESENDIRKKVLEILENGSYVSSILASKKVSK